MPPKFPPPAKPTKPYFFYGHRKPTQNRPTVHGGLFTNRQILSPNNANAKTQSRSLPPVDLTNWDPDLPSTRPNLNDPAEKFFSVAQTLSPIGRYILDSFRKHQQWGPSVVADLNKLRRVTPKLVAEVLKVPDIDRSLSTKFFHWAGEETTHELCKCVLFSSSNLE